MKPLTIAVTGASGFLGGHTTHRLVEAGHNVRALLRNGKALEDGLSAVTAIPGDLDDADALAKLVEGADSIVHLAGAIKAPNRKAFMDANRHGTTAIVAAWKRHAPKASFILTSSLAARHPELSHYAASKAEAESVTQGTGAVIFRPTAIYGPNDRETLRLFRAARLPVQVALNAADARLTFIHVSDVVDALMTAIHRPDDLRDKVIELCDSNLDGYSWRELVTAATACWARPARIVRLPEWVLRLGGRFGDLQAYCGKSPMLTSAKCNEILFKDWSVKSAQTLPPDIWSPCIEIDEGFKKTFDWYRNAGWL